MSTQIEAPERGMTIGNPAIRAVGPITFGPDGILFIADNVSAQVLAVDVADRDLTRLSDDPIDIRQATVTFRCA